jgi:biotin-dependent carboxylase-like uncharacterized protein
MDQPFVVSAGARLQFGSRAAGARAYLAVAGGIASARVLGSRATHVAGHMGGLDGRPLAAGDSVPLGDATVNARRRAVLERGRSATAGATLPAAREPRLRVLPGPHVERFPAGALDALQAAAYRVGNDSNRMGYRLEGTTIRHAQGADIISDATTLGAIQVPASGQPILLMPDRQTTGGYPVVATMITADISTAGQLAPGDRVFFEVCTVSTALAALIAQETRVMAIEAAAAAP